MSIYFQQYFCKQMTFNTADKVIFIKIFFQKYDIMILMTKELCICTQVHTLCDKDTILSGHTVDRSTTLLPTIP